MRPKSRSPLLTLLHSGICLLMCATVLRAETVDYHEGFDEGPVSWKVRHEQSKSKLLAHRRNEHLFLRGKAAENVEFEAVGHGAFIQLEHPLPAARVLEELTLSLWVRSNRAGAVVYLRVVFPEQIDPSSGNTLVTYIRGDVFKTPGRWQELKCSTTEKQIAEQLRLLRARLHTPNLETRGMYVDRAVITAQLEPGTTELFVDELSLSPVVGAQQSADVVQTAGGDASERIPVEFRLDRLLVNGLPFFPRMLPYHGEQLEPLKSVSGNVIWIPDYENTELAEQIRAQGMWVTATPPRAAGEDGRALPASDANILPFSPATRSILFWNLGPRIPPSAREDVISWLDQVRSADFRYDRPILGDVTGLERVYSRHLPMLGVSRHPLHTSFNFRQYRDWLDEKRKLARPGSFLWTWIQTEPAPALAERREEAGQLPLMAEPEQLRLQVYTALASGYRGLGYWKTASLDDDDVASVERRLALSQLNYEIELLEPWLATGTVVARVNFTTRQPDANPINQRRLDFRTGTEGAEERDALLRARETELKRKQEMKRELEATIIRSDYGLLLLPVWYETDAQYCPGQMAANDATIIVPGVDESASAWEVSTTAVRSLPRERVAGGLKITLSKFDQTAAVILSADQSLIARLREKMDLLAEPSARVSVELIKSKFRRTSEIDDQLQAIGVGQLDAPQLRGRAAALLARAEEALGRQDWNGARGWSADAGQLLRILQRAHWNDAVRRLSSPSSSPHTVSFQSLPDHYRLVAALGRSRLRNDVNLLRSGGFEDIDTMLVEGWEHAQQETPDVQATAELYPGGRSGNYCLRLIAVSKSESDAPAVLNGSPVVVSTPPLPVRAGQILHISGWVRVTSPIAASTDGAMFYDNLLGPVGSLRWTNTSGWERFEMLREVRSSGDLRLTMALTGLGEVQFDDLQVLPHTPASQGDQLAAPGSLPQRGLRERTLELLDRIPRLSNPIPRLNNPLPRLNESLPDLNPLNNPAVAPVGAIEDAPSG